jgi:hypothetical protein
LPVPLSHIDFLHRVFGGPIAICAASNRPATGDQALPILRVRKRPCAVVTDQTPKLIFTPRRQSFLAITHNNNLWPPSLGHHICTHCTHRICVSTCHARETQLTLLFLVAYPDLKFAGTTALQLLDHKSLIREQKKRYAPQRPAESNTSTPLQHHSDLAFDHSARSFTSSNDISLLRLA